MSGGGVLHAVKIDCLISKLLNVVCWLRVFARDELPELSRMTDPGASSWTLTLMISLAHTGSLFMHLWPVAINFMIYLVCLLEFIV